MLTDRYIIAAGIGASLEEFAAGYGLDIKPLARAAGIDTMMFKDLTGSIGLEQFCGLLDACAKLTNDEAFALKYAQTYSLGSSGPFGYGLLVAPTLRDFLYFHERHMPAVSAASYCRLSEDDGVLKFTWGFSPLITKRDQYVDLGLALFVRLMERITGPMAQSLKVDLERPKPEDSGLYREFIAHTIRFAQPANCISLPSHFLGVENPKADQRLFHLMDIQCASLTAQANARFEGGLYEQLREFITTRLKDEQVTLAEVASYFGIAERTLQRRLSELGTTLNEIRDEIRRELAVKLLLNTALSASDIGYRLGYSAPSAFARSFQRWHGQTPREFRRQSN